MLDYNFVPLIVAFAAIMVFAIVVGVVDLMGQVWRHGPAAVMAPTESPRSIVAQVAAAHALARIRSARPGASGQAQSTVPLAAASRTRSQA